eukprot:scaffold23625_cov137-Cylindrotheca_fusiformis.AAC.21
MAESSAWQSRRLVWLLVVGSFVSTSVSFLLGNDRQSSRISARRPNDIGLNLVPLSTFSQEMDFFSASDEHRCCVDSNGYFRDGNDTYVLGLVEEDDLADLCRFIVAAFGAETIRFSQDLDSFEQLLLSPAAELVNSYSAVVAFAEVFSGTQQRLATRFQKMDISPPMLDGLSREAMIDVVDRDSLILALVKEDTASREFIGSIELRLQPCDAKIPFSLPWLDRIERRLAAIVGIGEGNGDLQPYLSNLCVEESFRGRKIGRTLVRCVEDIAKVAWGKSRMYLHVDEENIAAFSLYCSEGYKDVGHRWSPIWAGTSADIGYYVKTLEKKQSKR